MTKTEEIALAIAGVLQSAGLTVRADTEALYSFEDHPCIVLDCGNEYPTHAVGAGFIYWNLEIQLHIGANGPVPKLAPEATRQVAHEALCADRTLGGAAIDIVVGQITRGIDDVNPACGITQVTYNVKYRVMENTA
ncbi:hypothetical protein BA896_012715 [Janthinobacterium lividum]|uniref:DUF3168 domain-containing protein n=1 Tax=Janthinobacterium lividum TaxID=29581 RepID=A0A1E8PUN2_9BURK|nr:hypothetical protein BA896_012715 [Janthinobacterium lividum]